jgi:hypothetical protein
LRSRIKAPDGFDLVAKEIKADRIRFDGRPNIQQTAAMGELPA